MLQYAFSNQEVEDNFNFSLLQVFSGTWALKEKHVRSRK